MDSRSVDSTSWVAECSYEDILYETLAVKPEAGPGSGLVAKITTNRPQVRNAGLEEETLAVAARMLEHSPLALRMITASMNAAADGLAGIQQLAGDATLLFYLSEEAQEGRDAHVGRRRPDFSRLLKRP